MRLAYLPIDPAAGFPQRFKCRVVGALLDFEIRYNSEGDFFTATIRDEDGDVIIYGRPFVYGSNLFESVSDPRVPPVPIVPADVAGVRDRVGQAEFMVDVFPFIMQPLEVGA